MATTTNQPESMATTTNQPESMATTTNQPESMATTTNQPESMATTTNQPESMATTTNQPKYSYSDFFSILESQSQLYELHTHLLGMGNAGFWIDTILCDRKIMPTRDMFSDPSSKFCSTLCRLIWKESEEPGFVNAERSAKFIEYLSKSTDIPWNKEEERKKVEDEIETNFGDSSSTFWNLIKDEKFNKEQYHRGMNFKNNFSYDVVLILSDLAKGLNVDTKNGDDIAQMKIAEKLGIYLSEDTKSIEFCHWIIFNARKQRFEIVYGLRVEDLRKLITIDITSPNEAKKNARAHIVNAFSMCDAQGTPARHVDFHNFRGAFTPEFYPRRFALKDSIYSQRLDILAALIYHVLKRYQTCLPPVKYCEFSVGVGDLSSPWVFDVLRSFPTRQQVGNPEENQPVTEAGESIYKATEKVSSFSQCVRDGSFRHLQVACRRSNGKNDILPSIPNVTYKFLVGFDRTNIQSSLFKNQNDALRLLNDSPHRAILLMRKEIWTSEKLRQKGELFEGKSEKSKENRETNLDKLEKLKEASKISWFYDWVVGIDLFADELGYPYCPFVTHSFITYINDIRKAEENGKPITTRKKYPHFGVRVHCGENVQYADDDAPAYRSFIAHMYIVFCCLRYLRYRLDYGIRIGHGIGFERILGESMSSSKHRKSSVLRAEMRHQAPKLFENIAFEVNITSNEYLLGDSLRQGNIAQTHCLNALLNLKAPIVLSTDDDGIWPIDRCSFVHPGHHSLTAEYCRAISSSLFTKPKDLRKILKNSKNFCFFDMKGHLPSKKYNLPKEDIEINTIILHPDLVEHILRRLKRIHKWKQEAIDLLNTSKIRPWTETEIRFFQEEILWTDVETNPLLNRENPRRLKDDSRSQEALLLKNVKRRILNDGEIDLWKQIRRLTEEEAPEEVFYKKYSPYYLPISDSYTYEDENLWITEYQSISQVAYICCCIEGHLIRQQEINMPDEYYWLFKNDENGEIFKYICDQWAKIYDEFMIFGKKISSRNYRCVLIKPPTFSFNSNQTPIKDDVVILSPIPNDDEKSPLDAPHGIDYITSQQERKQRIDIYIDRMNIDETDDVWKDITDQIGLKDLRVTYYTNRDKNKFTYIKSGTSFELNINPKFNQRNKDENNYLYALCEYAGASTAALHLVAKYIAPDSQHLAAREIVSAVIPCHPAESLTPVQQGDLSTPQIDDKILSDSGSNMLSNQTSGGTNLDATNNRS